MNNTDKIQQLYAHFAAKDNESIRSLFDRNIEWVQMEGFPNGGRYTGADEIFKNVFSGFREHWEEWKAVVEEYLDAGDSVFAIGYYEGIYKSSRKRVRAAFAHRYVLSNGKIIRFIQYTDTKLIAEAMTP